MNANDLAKDICDQEIDDHENNIAQVKQIMLILADNIAVRQDAAQAWADYVEQRRCILFKGQKK